MSLVNKIEEIVAEKLGITEKMLDEFHFELMDSDTRALGV